MGWIVLNLMSNQRQVDKTNYYAMPENKANQLWNIGMGAASLWLNY